MNSKGIYDSELEMKANLLRQEMNISFVRAISIHQILSEKKIIAYFYPMGERGLSGMAMALRSKTGENLRFMMVNSSHQYSRQRFTACHELYHLLFQENFNASIDNDTLHSKEVEEKRANIFASYLLLPELGLRALTPIEQQKRDKITLDTILRLEHTFRCSRGVLLIRLKEMGWTSEAYIQPLFKNVTESARTYGYSLSLYQPTNVTEIIGDYNLKARALLEHGTISLEKYVSMLNDLHLYDNLGPVNEPPY